jgi:hypothetical protein
MPTVETYFDEIDRDLLSQLEDLADYSASDGSGGYTQEMADKDAAEWLSKAHKSFADLETELKGVIAGIPNWGAAKVMLRPMYEKRGPIDFEGDEPRLNLGAHAYVYPGGNWKSAPGVTLFWHEGMIKGVDDVLDAGDTDFFDNPAIEAAYFMLVEELRHPGGAKRLGNKTVTLYTARPKKDRYLYENARSLPVNVFLTTSEDEAYGYSRDMDGRDIYMVRVKRMYLVETLDVGRTKNYQTFSGQGNKVPVVSCELIFEAGKTACVARRIVARYRQS